MFLEIANDLRQDELLQYGYDTIDAIILNSLKFFKFTFGDNKPILIDNKIYYIIGFKIIIDMYPILKLDEDGIYERIMKYDNDGLIEYIELPIADKPDRVKSYFHITDKGVDLFCNSNFDYDEEDCNEEDKYFDN